MSSHLYFVFTGLFLFWIGNKCFEGSWFPACAWAAPPEPWCRILEAAWVQLAQEGWGFILGAPVWGSSRQRWGPSADEVSSLKCLQRSERNEWVISFANEELQPGAALAEPSMWVQAVPFMSWWKWGPKGLPWWSSVIAFVSFASRSMR